MVEPFQTSRNPFKIFFKNRCIFLPPPQLYSCKFPTSAWIEHSVALKPAHPNTWLLALVISDFLLSRKRIFFRLCVCVCARASSFSNLITCVLSCLRFRFCLYLAAGCTLLFPSKLFFLFAPPPFSRTLYFYANTKVKIKDFRSDLFAISTNPVVDARKVFDC